MAESVLRLHRSVYVVFFIVLLPQQRPSRRDDDQPSTDLHNRQRNPEERQNVGPNKIRSHQQGEAVHGNSP